MAMPKAPWPALPSCHPGSVLLSLVPWTCPDPASQESTAASSSDLTSVGTLGLLMRLSSGRSVKPPGLSVSRPLPRTLF